MADSAVGLLMKIRRSERGRARLRRSRMCEDVTVAVLLGRMIPASGMAE